MNFNTNNWNRIRYGIYSPLYDIAGRLFIYQRKKSLQLLNAPYDADILIVGAGTGLDLEWMQDYTAITAIDITPLMVHRIKNRAQKLNMNVRTQVMDGQKLFFDDNSFDAVILHLVLAVIPDPDACIKEVERVLKPGGEAVIFDKFIPDNSRPHFFRRAINPLANFIASDLNRRLGDILSHTNLQPAGEIPAEFGGLFRIVKVKK